jgi:chromosome partitioning protein
MIQTSSASSGGVLPGSTSPTHGQQPSGCWATIVSANGKGGAGKTSTIYNLAPVWAEQGSRVLIVDLDPQSNQAEVCFGLDEHDEGISLYNAAHSGEPDDMRPIPVRDNIDLVPSGLWTAELGEDIVVYANNVARHEGHRRQLPRHRAAACLEVAAVIQEVGARYDIVLIDTPPAYGNALAVAGLVAGKHLMVPSRAGKMSRKGLEKLVRVYTEHGSIPTFMGVVLVGVNASAKSVIREERARLAGLFGADEPPILGVIRDAEKASYDQEEYGLSAVEYRDAVAAMGRRPGVSFARNIESLVGDYRQLAAAIESYLAQQLAQGAA